MPGWFDRALDRELGPATSGTRAVRESWLRDWPLLLGLLFSAALIAGSLAVRGSEAKPLTPPKTPAQAAASGDVPGQVVDVGEGETSGPAEGAPAGPKSKAGGTKQKPRAKAPAAPRQGASDEPGAGAVDTAPAEPTTRGRTPSAAPSETPSRGGSRPNGGSSGGSPTFAKIINVTGNSARHTNGPLSYFFKAPTHTPVVGKPWVLSVQATRAGAPLKAAVKLDVLMNGTVVGHVRTGQLKNGRFAHQFDWPARSIGHPLTVKATITGAGYSQSFLYDVKIKSAG